MSKAEKRVLIVDDNDEVLDAVAMFVASIGHIALTAAGGTEALDKLEHVTVDVVLTDLLMPGMSGHELAREIKKRRPTLPVVLMSVNSSRPYPYIDKVLTKPFSLAELGNAIGEVCQAQPSGAEPGTAVSPSPQ